MDNSNIQYDSIAAQGLGNSYGSPSTQMTATTTPSTPSTQSPSTQVAASPLDMSASSVIQMTPNPNMQITGTSNPKRSRITRACDTCRRKKIKCDVDSKQPCTTCRQYQWECTFHDTVKKRGPPKGYIESLETRLEKMESLLKRIGNTENDSSSVTISPKRIKRELSQDSNQQQRDGHHNMIEATPIELNSQTARAKVARYHGSSSGYYLVGNILSNEYSENKNQDLATPPQQNEQQQLGEKQKAFVVYNGRESSYRLRRMNVGDNDLMVIRDATADEEAIQIAADEEESVEEIVPRPVVEVLVHTYFNDAHTTLPVVEKEEYLQAFEGKIQPPPSPLLTYAICTYACFLLRSSHPVFKENGVERDEIFSVLLKRASMLVRKEYLKPRIVTIQALILMCGHPIFSISSYRNWILAGMAVRMAQDLGLHRTLTTMEASGEFKERRKRLWYSAYCTDRWCCAIMGRPLAIADSDCDVDLPLVNGPDQNEDLNMFVNFVKLSGILGEVLRRIYSPKAKLHGYKTKAMEQTVFSLQKMLEEWFVNVPDGYKITEYDLLDMRLNPQLYQGTKKVTEGGPMTVCYHAVVLLLHRPFIVLDDDDDVSRATELCTQAAKLAVNVARAIPHMYIAKFGWNFAAYSVFQAALIHMYNCTSKDPVIAKESKEYLDICTNECLVPLSQDIPASPPLIPFLQTLSGLLRNDVLEQPEQPEQPQQPQQPMMSDYMEQPENAGVPKMDNASWLLNGGNGNPALSQATWQQLFSTAGTPFTPGDNFNRGSDVQGWDSFFMDQVSNNNLFM